jgi:hypothetical protein
MQKTVVTYQPGIPVFARLQMNTHRSDDNFPAHTDGCLEESDRCG